jgi:hypothetical protein
MNMVLGRIEARKRRATKAAAPAATWSWAAISMQSQNCVAGSLGEHDPQFSTVRAAKRKFTPNCGVTRYLDLYCVLRMRIETVDHEGSVHVRDDDGTFTKGDLRYDFHGSAGYDAISITHHPTHADESRLTRGVLRLESSSTATS